MVDLKAVKSLNKPVTLKKIKERRGYKGMRNIKAYYFFGWAAY